MRHRKLCRSCFNRAKRERYASDEAVRQKASQAQSVRLTSGRDRETYAYYRFKAFELLGGPTCSRCGFSDPRALQVDHVDNDGAVRRRTAKETGRSLYRRIVEQGGGEGKFQVLCANCNWIKRAEYENRDLNSYYQEAQPPHKFRSKTRPEDTFVFFDTDEPLKAVAHRLKVSSNTLALWWEAEFGREAHINRGKRLQAAAAARTAKTRNARAHFKCSAAASDS